MLLCFHLGGTSVHLTDMAQGFTDATGGNTQVLKQDLWAVSKGNDHRDTGKGVKGDGMFPSLLLC